MAAMDKWVFVFICLVSSSNIYLVQMETIETWGELRNVRALEEKSAVAHWIPLKIRTEMLRFPSVINNNDLLNRFGGSHSSIMFIIIVPQEGEYALAIAAIQHVDYIEKPVTSTIVSGGVNSYYVEFKIESQRGNGINSTVIVFTTLDAE